MYEKIDLVSLPKKAFWKLSIPILGFVLFDAIYGLIDMYWVASLSKEALYAVSVSTPLFTLICSFGDSIGQGANSIMSRYIGTNNYEGSYNSIVHGLIVVGVVWILCLVSTLGLVNILQMMKITHNIGLVLTYCTPLFICSLTFLLSNYFSETLQAEGDSRTPTALMIGSNLLNMALDPIFIYTFNLGVIGAAYATILSSVICVVAMVYWYGSKRTKIPLSLKFFKVKPKIFFEILKVAIPNFFDNAVWCISATFINGVLTQELGPKGILLYATSSKIKDLLMAPVKGFGRGLMSVTGHLFGAKDIDNLKEMYKYVLKIALVYSFIISIVFIYFRYNIFQTFKIINMNASVTAISMAGVIILLSVPLSMISSKMLDGFGKSYYSLALTILTIAFEIGLISIIRVEIPYGISVLISITIAQFLAGIVNVLIINTLFRRFKAHKEDLKVV